MTELAVVPEKALSEMTLDELAEAANREYELGAEKLASCLDHWLLAGRALTDARNIISREWDQERQERGRASRDTGWGQWLEDNWHHSREMANSCIRLAMYETLIRDEGITTVQKALRYVRGLPSTRITRSLHSDEVKKEAARLVKSGLSYSEVARLVGVSSSSTIRRWTDPEYDRRCKDAVRRAQKATREKKEEQKRADQHRFIRKRGGNTGYTYGLIRQATQAVDRALEEEEDREIKQALRRAEALLHQADAAIVKALGLK